MTTPRVIETQRNGCEPRPCFAHVVADLPAPDSWARRIELAPATDAWMRGDRFATVIREHADGSLRVRLDRSQRTLTVPAGLYREV